MFCLTTFNTSLHIFYMYRYTDLAVIFHKIALQEITWSKTEEALRVRHKASGVERDTGVVAGTLFSH